MDPGVLENPGLLWGSVWEQEGSKPVGPMVISLPKRLSRRAVKGEQRRGQGRVTSAGRHLAGEERAGDVA